MVGQGQGQGAGGRGRGQGAGAGGNERAIKFFGNLHSILKGIEASFFCIPIYANGPMMDFLTKKLSTNQKPGSHKFA